MNVPRVAVVTGAGRGIGRALAIRLAHGGASVVVASRTAGDLAEVVAAIESAGGRAIAVVADAMDAEGAKEPVRTALATFGSADIVVNNVGGSIRGNHDPFDGDDDAFLGTLTLNLTSAFWTTKAALPAMRNRGWGRVINIGSGAARWSTPGGSLGYTTAKHGLVGYTRQLAGAVAGHGITVNCVCPGWTNTSLIDWHSIARRHGVTVEAAQSVALAANAQRRILEPEELGAMVALLAGDEGASITGQIIGVDGGYGL